MYKILIADDEQIVLDSLRYVISKSFKDMEIVASVCSGREAIEEADKKNPDIIIIDIKMPGINGIDAITEIRKSRPFTKFILLTAFDRFDYAKQAIDLGVSEYLLKPINRAKIIQALKNVTDAIGLEREKKDMELRVREKMEAVIPMLENGFIYAIIFSDDHSRELIHYKMLMNIDDGGYMMTIEFGEVHAGRMHNKIGLSVRGQKFYSFLKDTLKLLTDCIIGPLMLNRVVVFIPYGREENEYAQRIYAVDLAGQVYEKLHTAIPDVDFKLGIGSCYQNIGLITNSYNESLVAIKRNEEAGILHFRDIPETNEIVDGEIYLLGKNMIEKVVQGDPQGARDVFEDIFDRLIKVWERHPLKVKNKLLELIFRISHCGAEDSESILENNRNYFEEMLSISDDKELHRWCSYQISRAAEYAGCLKADRISYITKKAKEYIDENFAKEVNLEDVSKFVNISPYYFSKLFKNETGENFIDYLTAVRIQHGCQLLKSPEASIKAVSYACGYSDPNYFCRIFKKMMGCTPTEYKEIHGG